MLGFIIGAVAGAVLTSLFLLGPWPPIGLALLGAAAGHLLGSFRRSYECSDPRCGGTISGEVRKRDDRLEAEERLDRGSVAGGGSASRSRQ